MIVLVDFDDTLHDTRDRRPGHRMGQPEPGAVMAINYLYQAGDEIVVFTGRRVDQPNVYKTVEDWLLYFRIPYHAITNVKPTNYDVVVDNKALHYDAWEHVLVQISHIRRNEKAWADESTRTFDATQV